jgi:NAD(P)-dependent dehydrogenase (short-subunit alcohol dehydrogenase family)
LLAQELGAQTECVFVRTDVRDSNAVQALVNAAKAKFERLDVMVNSAGVEGNNNLIHELPDDEFDRVVAINLRGTFLVTKYTVPWLIASGGGSIVNVASPFGYIGGAEISPYCASKGGVIQLTKCTAIEYAKQNIRANCISPGIVDTPMTERTFQVGGRPAHFDNLFDRMAAPREMGEVILFLASDRSSFVTGMNLIADGGKTAD